MNQKHVGCTSCGAPMKPQPDGRTYSCAYCGTQLQVAVESAQIAAGLRLDLSNLDVFMHQLATTLYGSFAESTQVRTEGARVIQIEFRLDPHLFLVRREPQGVLAQYKKLVRGVALKTATHPLERWVELLTKAVAEHANTNARAAQVLAHLRGS